VYVIPVQGVASPSVNEYTMLPFLIDYKVH
jgi:hypothetical protein